ncbi:hypothetical protein GCM10023334_085860 [Nonomuraea thailandensis]
MLGYDSAAFELLTGPPSRAAHVWLREAAVQVGREQASAQACSRTDLVFSADPFLKVKGLSADRRVGAVPGVHDRLRWEGEQPMADGVDDQVEVGERAAGRTRPSLEESVSREDGADGPGRRRNRRLGYALACAAPAGSFLRP